MFGAIFIGLNYSTSHSDELSPTIEWINSTGFYGKGHSEIYPSMWAIGPLPPYIVDALRYTNNPHITGKATKPDGVEWARPPYLTGPIKVGVYQNGEYIHCDVDYYPGFYLNPDHYDIQGNDLNFYFDLDYLNTIEYDFRREGITWIIFEAITEDTFHTHIIAILNI